MILIYKQINNTYDLRWFNFIVGKGIFFLFWGATLLIWDRNRLQCWICWGFVNLQMLGGCTKSFFFQTMRQSRMSMLVGWLAIFFIGCFLGQFFHWLVRWQKDRNAEIEVPSYDISWTYIHVDTYISTYHLPIVQNEQHFCYLLGDSLTHLLIWRGLWSMANRNNA